MTKQRPRRVGLGMKPREYSGTQGVSNHAEEKHLGYVSTTPSVAVGREEAPIEGEIEAVSGIAEGGNHDFSSRQNSDSTGPEVGEEVSISPKAVESAPIVARNEFSEPLPAVSQEAFDSLAAMMKASENLTGADPQFTVKPIPGREYSNLMGPTEEQLARAIYYEGKSDGGKEIRSSIIYEMGVDVATGSERVVTNKVTPLGELPNGEYRSTVRVGEGYIEGIKAQAEADGQSLEDWLTFQLQERLEQWFFAAGAR